MPLYCPFCALPTELRIQIIKLLPRTKDLESAVDACACLQATLDYASHEILVPLLEDLIEDPFLTRITLAVQATDAGACVENFDECRRIVLHEETPRPKQPITLADLKRFQWIARIYQIIIGGKRFGQNPPDRERTRLILAIFHTAFFLDAMWPYRNDTSMSDEAVYAIGAKWFSRSTPWAKEQVCSIIDMLTEQHRELVSNFSAPGEKTAAENPRRPRFYNRDERWRRRLHPLAWALDDGADLKGNRWITNAHVCLEKQEMEAREEKFVRDYRAENGQFGVHMYNRALACMPFSIQYPLFTTKSTERLDACLKVLRDSVSPAVCIEDILWQGPSFPDQVAQLRSLLGERQESVREGKEELYDELTCKQFDYDDELEGGNETSKCEINWRRCYRRNYYPKWVAHRDYIRDRLDGCFLWGAPMYDFNEWHPLDAAVYLILSFN